MSTISGITNTLSSSYESLSSGKRINGAADDAAHDTCGQIIVDDRRLRDRQKQHHGRLEGNHGQGLDGKTFAQYAVARI